MRRSCLILLPLLALLSGGCDLLVNFTRNVAYEVSRCSDETIECYRFRKEAEQAWKEANAHCPEPLSADFARGFKQGYAEYLEAGGCGEPPPAPPCGYWMTKGRLQEYFQAVKDWSNGYRAGAALAHAKGVRLPGIMPLPAPGPGGAWPPHDLNGWPGWMSGPVAAPPEPQPLPTPRREAGPGAGAGTPVPSVFVGRTRR